MASLYELQKAYLIEAARARGIDPDVAVKAMGGEGLNPDVWQSNAQQPYGRERSYGAMQLHVAPEGSRPGMGNDFQTATGLDASDPNNYKQMIDFGLDNVVKGGWGPWYGAKARGVTGMMGVGDDAHIMPAGYTQELVPPTKRTGPPSPYGEQLGYRTGPPTPYEGTQAPEGTPAAMNSSVATAVGAGDPAKNALAARALALQKYTREGGTGGLGAGPPQFGSSLADRMTQGHMAEGLQHNLVDPLKEKAQSLMAFFTGKKQPVVTPASYTSKPKNLFK